MASRAAVKLEDIPKLRNSLYKGTDNELGAVVRKSLLLESHHGALSQDSEQVDFVAEIPKEQEHGKSKAHMMLIWRRTVAGFNVRCQLCLLYCRVVYMPRLYCFE